MVIRIDDVGRPRRTVRRHRVPASAPELRYFLTQFIVKHFSRLRATVQREYPDSLLFLEPALADARLRKTSRAGCGDVHDEPSADEVDIVIQT